MKELQEAFANISSKLSLAPFLLFLQGVALIFFVWVKDNGWTNWRYDLLPRIDESKVILVVGLILTLTPFLYVAIFFLRRAIFRYRYSRKKMGKDFILVTKKDLGHKAWLIDIKRKKKHWIGNNTTLFDLNFYNDDYIHWEDLTEKDREKYQAFEDSLVFITRGSPAIEPKPDSF